MTYLEGRHDYEGKTYMWFILKVNNCGINQYCYIFYENLSTYRYINIELVLFDL